jgi:hypothetical protein
MNQFYKGRTNQHLSWVMVDATDFATPESAVSAATTIKIYGKVRGATGVHFVSSGAGSLTNDIQHVGASATGIYTIALAKADLSDASNAWYDQYIITLSATGCARQTLVVDGGIDASALLVGASAASDAHSAALLVQSRLSDLDSRLVSDISDIRSAISDAHSDIYSVVSDLYAFVSFLTSDVKSAVLLTQSLASDAHSAAAQANSRVLLVQSRLSDLDSRLVSDISDLRSAVSDAHSDLKSAIGGITAAVSASDISDIASAVWANTIGARVDSRVLLTQSMASDAHSAANIGNSRILLVQSRLSDLDSRLASEFSDVQSNLSNIHSDLKSAIAGITVTLDASNISDIASAVVAALPITSAVSDIYSLLSDLNSNFHSRIPAEPSSRSQLSDAHSDLKSAIGAITVTLDASNISDIASAVVAALPITSAVSDIYSLLSDLNSNFHSRIPVEPAARSQLSDLASDVKSAVLLTQSMASDAHSAAAQANSRALVIQSLSSDAHSAAILGASHASDAHSAATLAASRALLNQSRISDVQSFLTAMSGMLSDTHSAAILGASHASDAHSAANVAASRITLVDDFVDTEVAAVLAAVDTEVAAILALLDDARAEPGQGAPPASADMATKVDYLYKWTRNKKDNDGTTTNFYADDGSTVDHKQTVSESGGTVTKGEIVTGP